MKRSFFFALAVFFLFSCSSNKGVPEGIITPAKMRDVMWDMISAGEFLTGYVYTRDSMDRVKESSFRYGQVLQFHKISRETWESSFEYYRGHPALMKELLDSLSKRTINPADAYKPTTDTVAARVDTNHNKPPLDIAVPVRRKGDSLRRDSFQKARVDRLRKFRH